MTDITETITAAEYRRRYCGRASEPQKPPAPPEGELHRAIVEYLELVCRGRFFAFHPANGGARTPVEAALFKAMGVRPGVADIVLMLHGGRAAFLEVKTETGKLSSRQREFREVCKVLGHPYRVVRSIDDVAAALEGLMEVEGR